MSEQEQKDANTVVGGDLTQPLLEPIGKSPADKAVQQQSSAAQAPPPFEPTPRPHRHPFKDTSCLTCAGTSLLVQVEDAPRQPGSPLAQLSPTWVQLGNTHWLLTTAIMLSDMFGLGTLSLPAGDTDMIWHPSGLPGMVCNCKLAALVPLGSSSSGCSGSKSSSVGSSSPRNVSCAHCRASLISSVTQVSDLPEHVLQLCMGCAIGSHKCRTSAASWCC
jgi:hypothetical protein